uniref:Uncharacterized protein n=1 Tax=Cacopsylla melanoneura TaxID=428564 RepID=A0A8D8YEF2_9HEMI
MCAYCTHSGRDAYCTHPSGVGHIGPTLVDVEHYGPTLWMSAYWTRPSGVGTYSTHSDRDGTYWTHPSRYMKNAPKYKIHLIISINFNHIFPILVILSTPVAQYFFSSDFNVQSYSLYNIL